MGFRILGENLGMRIKTPTHIFQIDDRLIGHLNNLDMSSGQSTLTFLDTSRASNSGVKMTTDVHFHS